VAGFVGRFEHSVDSKGRVILPVRFRDEFARGGFLTPNREGCVALRTPGENERQMAEMLEAAKSSADGRNQARVWAANTAEIEIDKQGRMAIPSHLREFAQLDGDVLIHGAIDRIELWNPAQWNERVKPMEAWFLEGDE
jgi:MraZ protein